MSQKIVFMGTPEFSVPILESLLNSDNKIISVYSQPASKSNRGQKKTPSSIEVFSKKKNLNLRTPNNLDENEYEFLTEINPDIVIVVAYGKIIPKKFLEIPKNGFINIHASLLPKWRGAAPIQRSIMNLDRQSGISIMKIVEKLDAGPVMHQDRIDINENIDTATLSNILSKIGARSILEAIKKIGNGQAKFVDQDDTQATYAKKISKAEAKINWDEDAKKILAKINGLNPNPGAWFEYKNTRYKIWKAEIINQSEQFGKLINDQLTVACANQSIKILEIQKEGKDKQLAKQFLLGNWIKKGEILV